MGFLLFVFGAAIGSFLCVVADRYKPDRRIWDVSVIGGRSRCDSCHAALRWFELIPLASFLSQKGKCRRCGAALSWRYSLVELAAGFLFAFVPSRLAGFSGIRAPFTLEWAASHPAFIILSLLWAFVFATLLLISLIDARLHLIPDEANVFLLFAGALIVFLSAFGGSQGSFLKEYDLLFGVRGNIWLNHLLALGIAGILFASLIFITRGRGMGTGDFKLASALGFVFGWPDIFPLLAISFIVGSLFGLGMILAQKKGLKSRLAFGPFLGLSSFIVFSFGYEIVSGYFKIFG